jgi:hypothetical protein
MYYASNPVQFKVDFAALESYPSDSGAKSDHAA